MSDYFPPQSSPTLDALALGFVLRTQGFWTQGSLEPLIDYLNKKEIPYTREKLDACLVEARERFESGDRHLFVCQGRPCRKRHFENFESTLRESMARLPDCRLTLTECQGPCKEAPFATLRIGDQCQMFSRWIAPEDWSALFDHIKNCVQEKRFVDPSDSVSSLAFNPVDGARRNDAYLEKLDFLIGTFKGVGEFIDYDMTFEKTLVGQWELQGRFISLRLSATYPEQNGRRDTHQVMAMIGVDHDTGDYRMHAYTDHGLTRQFALTRSAEGIAFEDAPPSRFVRALKRVRHTGGGLEETLEVDAGDGSFKPYYVVRMTRVNDE